ncbi:tRNA methyltransferase tyw3 [Mactra antiquata]
MSRDVFDNQKKTCLSSVDLSRKGSIDAPILDIVQFINEQANFFTTSSCSGRLLVIDNDVDGLIKKQGCKWILTSHDCIMLDALKEKLVNIEGNAVFKFEPFVMHIQCRSLDDAQLMLRTAVGSGYRNSGISVGNKGKFITAIRSTHSLEVPLTNCGKLLVSNEYLEFLVNTGNNKMKENLLRIDRLFTTLKSSLTNNGNLNQKKFKTNSNGEEKSGRQDAKPISRNEDIMCKKQTTLPESSSIEDLTECSIFSSDFKT